MELKLVTWNVNSINARMERVLPFIERTQPDVLCLQELKAETEAFPAQPFLDLGYEPFIAGQKRYNGVGILVKKSLNPEHYPISDPFFNDEARLIAVRVCNTLIFSAYIPNGREVGTVFFAQKLAWLKRLKDTAQEVLKSTSQVILCGDFNIAPRDSDSYAPAELIELLHHSTEERNALKDIIDVGFFDTTLLVNDNPGYSWWDYQRLAFPFNKGLRIDLILASHALKTKVKSSYIDRDERRSTKTGPKPSDHAPVVTCFDL